MAYAGKKSIKPGKIDSIKDTKHYETKAKPAKPRTIFSQRKKDEPVQNVKYFGRKNLNNGRDGRLSVDQGLKVTASKHLPSQRRFILSPKFPLKDRYTNADLNEEQLERPATVALPHIPGQRLLSSPDPAREWCRRSLPNITANGQELKSKSPLNRHSSNTEIDDFRNYPLDKLEREFIEKNSKQNQLDPVSYTYLMWLEENPQTVIKLRNHGLGTKSLSILRNSLENNNIVEELDLAGNNLNDIGIEDLALLLRGNMHISALDLSSNVFSSKGIIAVGNLLEANKTLSNLCLSRNNLTDTDLELLCSGLEDTDNKLKILDLSFNNFTPQAGFTLGRLLTVDKTLEELDIQGNSMGPIGSWQVFNGLRNSSLKKLNMSANEISEDGIMYIAEINELGKTLNNLDLSDNFITKLGIKYFMPMLEGNRTLNTLKLDNNPIGTNGLIHLLQSLIDNGNVTLTQVYVKGAFADETVKCLCSKIRERNSKFIMVGALGIYATQGVDTLKTLQIYLKNNKIIDTKHLHRLQSID